MRNIDIDSADTQSMPRSSLVFLFFVFGAFAFLIQLGLLIADPGADHFAFETFYSPAIDWILGGFPRDGENTTIFFGVLVVCYSTAGGFIGLAVMKIIAMILKKR